MHRTMMFLMLAGAEAGGKVIELKGDTPMLYFGQPQGNITLLHNASEPEKLTCSGEIEATDVRIVGTNITVAQVIAQVTTQQAQLTTQQAQLTTLQTQAGIPAMRLRLKGCFQEWGQAQHFPAGRIRWYESKPFGPDLWYDARPARSLQHCAELCASSDCHAFTYVPVSEPNGISQGWACDAEIDLKPRECALFFVAPAPGSNQIPPAPFPPPGSPPPPPEYVVHVTSGRYPNEVGWTLACSDGPTLRGGAPFTGIISEVVEGSSCTLTMTDSYGDGWNGATWSGLGLRITLESQYGRSWTKTFEAGPSTSPPPPPPTPPPPPSSLPGTWGFDPSLSRRYHSSLPACSQLLYEAEYQSPTASGSGDCGSGSGETSSGSGDCGSGSGEGGSGSGEGGSGSGETGSGETGEMPSNPNLGCMSAPLFITV